MIKRDYGVAKFGEVVDAALLKSRRSVTLFCLQPMRQVCQALSFIYMFLVHEGGGNLTFNTSKYEKAYANVVKECLERYEAVLAEESDPAVLDMLRRDEVYLNEARSFVNGIRNDWPIDKYCVEKTARVLGCFVFAIGRFAGIPDSSLDCSDYLYNQFFRHPEDKVEVANEV